MQYQGRQISMQELPDFIKGLPEKGCYFLDNMKAPSKGGPVITKSGLIEAIQSSEIPEDDIIINRIHFKRLDENSRI